MPITPLYVHVCGISSNNLRTVNPTGHLLLYAKKDTTKLTLTLTANRGGWWAASRRPRSTSVLVSAPRIHQGFQADTDACCGWQ
jgi:hypothetical protein